MPERTTTLNNKEYTHGATKIKIKPNADHDLSGTILRLIGEMDSGKLVCDYGLRRSRVLLSKNRLELLVATDNATISDGGVPTVNDMKQSAANL